MGLFQRKTQENAAPPEIPKPKPFRIELGWRGMFGVIMVCLTLFLWMFLLGIWAGQTYILPPRPAGTVREEPPAPPPAAAMPSREGVPAN